MHQLNVTRTENKYLLSPQKAAYLRKMLAEILPLDSQCGTNGYLVRSLYFDTVENSDYYDKVNGLRNRRKIRLRIYSPDDKSAKLEVKEKQGDNQWKRSLIISRADAGKLISGQYGRLNKVYDTPFANQVLHRMEIEGYRPKNIVQFQRIAHVCRTNDTRITFDFDLKFTESNFELFSETLSLCPVLHPIILEVKYRRFLLSYIKSALHIADSQRISTSKYCLCRQFSF